MSEKKPTLGAGLISALEWMQKQQKEQPSIMAEAAGLWRQGREDTFNNLLVAFPGSMALTREQGAPGSPTSQLTTEDLTGKEVDIKTDMPVRKSVLGYELVHPEQSKEREQAREM